jgi:hypothetical protein
MLKILKSLQIQILLCSILLLTGTGGFGQSKFHHDYSQSLVMKLVISVPDGNGGTRLFNNFDDALEIIKTANNLSLGVPKILYLVGWQYNGHDDKYPAFFEVNKALKCAHDKDARESLIWLMNEARKYNTIVSLHINMTDAYEDSPLWNEYVEKDMISKTAYGNLMVIGQYNNREAYQINYKKEWENGYAQMRIDRLLELLPPLKDAATIHLDAWIVRDSKGHYESAVMEAEYQKKILNYWNEKGLDVTSEWVIDYMVGKVPFAWHFNHMTQQDYLRIPANVYTGSGLNPDVKGTDFGLGFLFGKSMYGETVFPSLRQYIPERNSNWTTRFTADFYLNCLQYFFLNKLERLKVEGEGDNRNAYFSENVKVSLADSTVFQGENLLREKDFVAFPTVWKKEKCLAVYSGKTVEKTITIPSNWRDIKQVEIYRITPDGEEFFEIRNIENGIFSFGLEAGQPYQVRPKILKE